MVILAHCWHIGFLAHIKQQGYPLSFWRMKRWRPDESQCNNHNFIYHIVACLEKLKKKTQKSSETPPWFLKGNTRIAVISTSKMLIYEAYCRLRSTRRRLGSYQKWDPWHCDWFGGMTHLDRHCRSWDDEMILRNLRIDLKNASLFKSLTSTYCRCCPAEMGWQDSKKNYTVKTTWKNEWIKESMNYIHVLRIKHLWCFGSFRVHSNVLLPVLQLSFTSQTGRNLRVSGQTSTFQWLPSAS